MQEMQEAKDAGADIMELRLDYLTDLDSQDPLPVLEKLITASKALGLPAIVTLRPAWEG